MKVCVDPEHRLTEIQVKEAHYEVNDGAVCSAAKAMKSALSIVQFQTGGAVPCVEGTS